MALLAPSSCMDTGMGMGMHMARTDTAAESFLPRRYWSRQEAVPSPVPARRTVYARPTTLSLAQWPPLCNRPPLHVLPRPKTHLIDPVRQPRHQQRHRFPLHLKEAQPPLHPLATLAPRLEQVEMEVEVEVEEEEAERHEQLA